MVGFYSISATGGYLKLNLFYTYIIKVVTLVEGQLKASFSIITTPRSKGGRYSIPRIAPLYD